MAPPPATVQQPKLVLESPQPPPSIGQGTGQIKSPGGGVQEAIRELAHSGSSAKSVGDETSDQVIPDFNPTPSPTRPKSSLELLSDPKGVDFKPYLLQVLQNVRRNWFAVMPESARLGERGRVVLQFAIAKDGKITKVIFSTESGAKVLDRAAVAALSASDPLPQLPPEFKGDRVVLQFTFLYNAPR
jgi:TonB family protein